MLSMKRSGLVAFVAAFGFSAAADRPETWYHFIGGNVSTNGIAADLRALKEAGIGGVQLFHGQFGGGLWPGVTEQIPCLSAKWNDVLSFLGGECARLGLSLKVQNCPGWAMSGGPWIAPSNAMREVVMANWNFKPGEPVKGKMWPAYNAAETWRDYRDICVLAFPTPAGEADGEVKPVRVDGDIYDFGRSVTLRSIVVPPPSTLNHAWSYEPDVHLRLAALGENGTESVVLDVEMPRGTWQESRDVTFALDERTAVRWRFTVAHRHEMKNFSVRFSAAPRLDNWEGLAGWTLRDLTPPRVIGRSAGTCLEPKRIYDITARMNADGVVDWTPPEPGAWTVARFGHVNTGAKNGPAPEEATGWECDKLARRGAEAHFPGYVGRLATGPLKGKVKGMVIDSWECARQTWTEEMEHEFRVRRGYALRPWLPALFGFVIGDDEATERMLRDWRRTLSEMTTENYFGRMAELAHEAGLMVQFETAFGDVIPGDMLEYWKYADEPMCEFWSVETPGLCGDIDFKPTTPCVSAAHLYGKRRVTCEAFTGYTLTWNERLRDLKARANQFFARGVTHLVFHTCTHQPQPNPVPPGTSLGAWIGTPFIRTQTWWHAMPNFTDYLTRCGTVLEKGVPVVDVLWYLGDDYAHRPSEKTPFPEGWKYDFCNADALLNRLEVRNGRWCTPEGVSYSVLWVPLANVWREDTATKIAAAERAGGKVVRTADQGALLEALGEPDVRDGGRVDWYHRRDAVRDYYFVTPKARANFRGILDFRATGKVSVYSPQTGERRAVSNVDVKGGRTQVQIEIANGDGMVVIFDRVENAESSMREIAVVGDSVAGRELVSTWRLHFSPGWDAPNIFETERLCAWKDLPLTDAARAYSGTVVYTTRFPYERGETGKRVTLDLGRVESVAHVKMNARNLGVLYAEPYRVDVTESLRTGENELEIAISDTWFNRVVYDKRRPENERRTWTLYGPCGNEPFVASGLLGPVRLTEKNK